MPEHDEPEGYDGEVTVRAEGRQAQTARAERVCRHAGVITGVGYNYRWAPLVRYAKQQLDDGALGTLKLTIPVSTTGLITITSPPLRRTCISVRINLG